MSKLTEMVEETNEQFGIVDEAVKKAILKVFPKSHVGSTVARFGYSALMIDFTLGNGPQQYRNGIRDNDTAITQFVIEGIGTDEMVIERFRGGGFSIEDETGRYHFETVKVPFRKARAKDVKKVEQIFTKYFTKLKSEMKKYGDRIQNFDLIGKNI